jgi:hypothetical protein
VVLCIHRPMAGGSLSRGLTRLHDHSTRAPPHRRHRFGSLAVAVAAFFFSAPALFPSSIEAAESPDLEVSSTPDAALGAEVTSPGHDLAIELVEPGREGLEFEARLTDMGGTIERNISWTVVNASGETVYSGATPTADMAVPPGDYEVALRYGAVKLVATVSLLESNRLKVSFVLNAGGLRVLPRVKNQGLPPTGVKSRVFALGGRSDGKLVAESNVPGEIIRVPAGDYRVESRFAPGNAKAVVDVHVKAGKMSAIDIDHKAGIARLAFVGSPEARVRWAVSDRDGQPVAALEGLNGDVVLAPGTYTAKAEVGGETLTATFDIASGQARDILLGN